MISQVAMILILWTCIIVHMSYHAVRGRCSQRDNNRGRHLSFFLSFPCPMQRLAVVYPSTLRFPLPPVFVNFGRGVPAPHPR